MRSYLHFVQILVSIILIAIILLQAKGAGLGGIFGSQTSVFRTKRGVEKTLFQFTIILAVIFLIISMVSVGMGR
ncbi:MAG: preprotein translocase subunit SecG [Chloroflexi bacterium RBG_13_54_9]|nr:MAG: preprotein translocase subunit SecG [Chloroflexi bacterium RBG_13_54_9]